MSSDTQSTPAIIGPDEHHITPDLIDPDALYVLRKLNAAGHNGYLVGGGVRDLYLGKTPKDFDIGTNARPGQIRRLFSNSRTIGRRFRLVQVFFKRGKIIEVSTLRSLSEHDLDGPEAVLAPNITYGTVGEDAQRRDLTINALFYEIEQQTIIDYVGGFSDLRQGIIRIIGNPEKRINRDPVRMMRAIRHAARIAFSIETSSWRAVRDNNHKLSLCPPSRLRDEVLKDIYSGCAADWFALSVQSGIFGMLFPVYRDIATDSGHQIREQLESIFHTIDRLNNAAAGAGVHRQPDYFLLSFLLIPWAQRNFAILEPLAKGRNLFNLATGIRDALNEGLGTSLNLPRICRQEISTLLAHLPNIMFHQTKHNWPKWLKRKSYFRACQFLYQCHLEASGGPPVPDNLLLTPKTSSAPPAPLPVRQHASSDRKGRPAFVANRPGGIFGFKK